MFIRKGDELYSFLDEIFQERFEDVDQYYDQHEDCNIDSLYVRELNCIVKRFHDIENGYEYVAYN